MTTVYLDELIALNLMVDYLLLSAAAALGSVYSGRVRRLAAAAFGAAYAAVAFLFPRFLSSAPVKLLCGLGMVWIAFGFGNIRNFLRRSLLFALCGAIFGGFILLMAGFGRGGLQVNGGILYADIPGLVIAALCACAYILLGALLRFSSRTAEEKPGRVQVRICHRGREAKFDALLDTGNRLRDPAGGERVLICEAGAAAPLFPEEAAAAVKQGADAAQALQALARCGCARGFRLIPYRAVGVPHGLLLAFKPEQVYIADKRRRDVVVALTPSPIDEDAQCRAVMGI